MELENFHVNINEKVIIFLPKSENTYSTIYSVVAMGGCYIPIDYAAPINFVLELIRSLSPRYVITTSKKIFQLFSINIEHICHNDVIAFDCLKQDVKKIPTNKNENSNICLRLDDDFPAVILHTSGTTGKPKGIIHSYSSIQKFISWACGYLQLSANDNIAQVASIGFDLSIFDIFASIKVGASLIPVSPNLFGRINKIGDFIEKNKITIWYSTPSTLLSTVDEVGWSKIKNSCLRHIIFAGEVIPKNTLLKFWDYIPEGCEVHNWYGPTETNVCTFHKIIRNDVYSKYEVPIGKMCPYSKMVHSELSEGVFELVVRSKAMMLAYSVDGKRNLGIGLDYSTGDFVCKNKKGQLVFIGRKDRQIKLRGHRVQLEEIEVAINLHSSVSNTVCGLINSEGRTYLVALVQAIVFIKSDDIVDYLSDYLRSYMIPEKYIFLDKIPITDRGKVDMNAVQELFNEMV